MDDAEDLQIDAQRLDVIDFHHPFKPYHVQEQFMKAAFQVLQNGQGQVGLLESPTGTGKSLSLICASLTWLRRYKSQRQDAALEAAAAAYKDEPPWLIEQLLQRQRDELNQKWQLREKRLESARLKERERKREREQGPRKRQRRDNHTSAFAERTDDDEAKWLVDDWQSPGSGPQDVLSGLSKDSMEVLKNFGIGGSQKHGDDEDMLGEDIKIYYTSRTHSQLSQFIAELQLPKFPSSLPRIIAEERGKTLDMVKLLPLSSRQRLCINPSVSQLGSAQAINDRCAELQQAKMEKKCPYAPNEELAGQTHLFRDTALATLPDIEDMHQLGKSLQVCPYYASRAALPAAEIVTLPYPLLLLESAREALGIKLEGNVVIIDEAHNIMDAVADVHAAEMKLSELRKARGMLGTYAKRFGMKLKGETRVNVGRLGRVVDGLTEWMETASKFKEEHGVVTSSDLTRPKGIDQINLSELVQYIHGSKIAYKIEGYAAQVESEKEAGKSGAAKMSRPLLHELVSLLVALTNTSSEGRFFYRQMGGTPADLKLSYLLLSPTHAFSPIVSRARAVILAGGTISPFEDYKNHLFPGLPECRVTTLSCEHVVPPRNVCVRTLVSNRSKAAPFEFSFHRRGAGDVIEELGIALLNICSVVPDGVVVFFPSYGYLEQVTDAWRQQHQQAQPSTWDRLQGRKSVFLETKGGSSDEVLGQYSEAILGTGGGGVSAKTKGALLLSVVGGKMSEGINFSDRLGRCVVMVGMPYPNAASPEWKAKMEYVESSMGQTRSREEAKQAARDFYENSCMRAVNQSIGRAIRHQGDYAAIVLADRRYGTARIRNKLPGWIRNGMTDDDSADVLLGGLIGALARFFRSKA